MIPQEILSILKFVGPLAPLFLFFWLFRDSIQITVRFDGSKRRAKATRRKGGDAS